MAVLRYRRFPLFNFIVVVFSIGGTASRVVVGLFIVVIVVALQTSLAIILVTEMRIDLMLSISPSNAMSFLLTHFP